jgi:hypothetical protein
MESEASAHQGEPAKPSNIERDSHAMRREPIERHRDRLPQSPGDKARSVRLPRAHAVRRAEMSTMWLAVAARRRSAAADSNQDHELNNAQ